MTESQRGGPDAFSVTLPLAPYPGLRPFDTNEWSIFFGRERMSDEVVTRLVRDQFLFVHGDSGCGKSSLIRAGVLPRLEQENARGGLTWRTSVTQPRNAPLELLAEALAALDGHPGDEARTTEIRRVLNFGADAPRALAAMLRRGETDHICVLVDQFEELFAFARRQGPTDARLFVQILVALLEQPPQGLYVVVTMRSEFLGVCAHFPGLAEAVNRAQYLLPRMAHADLTRAIREPAALYGGQIAPDLAERLITDSGGSQDQLPLIQHGLMLLSRTKRTAKDDGTAPWRIEVADYEAVGDLTEALSRHADEVLDPVEQEPYPVAESVFRSLTEINADGQAVRRPCTVAQLAATCGSDVARVITLVNAFRAEGASFLTPFGDEPIGETTLVDISHEALIRCWARIANAKNGWLVREFQDGLVWRSLLVQAESFERNATHLLSLSTAEEQATWLSGRNPAWAERYGGGWDRVRGLVDASLFAGHAAVLEQQTQVRKRQRYRNAIGLVLAVFAVTFAFLNTRANGALARANNASAESLWNRLDFSNADRIQDDELNALWEVRLSNDALRSSFFGQLSTLQDRVARLSKRPQPILRALHFRWAPDNATAVRDSVLREAGRAADAASLIALAPAVQATAPFMGGAQAQAMLGRYLQAIRDTKTAIAPVALSGAMQALASKIDGTQAQPTLTTVLDTLGAPPATEYLFAIGAAASAVADRLPLEQTDGALTNLLTAIAATGDANRISALTPAAQTLARRVSAERVDSRLRQALDALGAAQSQAQRSSLILVAQELAVRTTAPQAGAALAIVIGQGLLPTNDAHVGALAAVAPLLAARATPEDIRRVAGPLVKDIGAQKDARRAVQLTRIAQPLMAQLGADDRRVVVSRVVQLLKASTNALEIDGLSLIVTTQADTLDAEQSRQTASALVGAARYATEDVPPDAMASAATRVAARLTPAEAVAQMTSVLKRIETTVAPGELIALSSMLPAFAAGLSPTDAARLLPDIWQWINATTDTAQLKALSFAVPALASRLSVENVRTSLPICMRYLVGTQDPDQIGALALASRTLADLLPAEARARALAPVQLRVDSETDPDRLARLSSVIPALALGMTPAQADALFPRLTSAMENTLYADQLLTLKVAAAAVTTKVSRDTVAPFVAAVAKALASASDIDRIDALTATMQALGARTDAGLQGDLRLTLIAWSATPDQAAAAVRAFLETPTGDSGEVRVQSLVEILKYPTVTGQAAHHVLDALRVLNAQAPGGDAGLDASLRWLATTYPGLRIDTAPVCPSPILPALKCPSTAGVSLFGLGAAGR